MSVDYFALLKRFEGRKVCLTLHGPSSLVGYLKELHPDCVRLSQAHLVSDLDLSGSSGAMSTADGAHGGLFRETLVHLNQVVAVSCLDDTPEPDPDACSDLSLDGIDAPLQKLLITPVQIRLGKQLEASFPAGAEAELQEGVETLRQKMAAELGVMIPEVGVSGDSSLPEKSALLLIRGVTAARWQFDFEKVVALEGPEVTKNLPGKRTPRNVFGAGGVWIRRVWREQAELYGYHVLGTGEILCGYLAQVLRLRAADLFGRQELELVLDQARRRSPALVLEAVPEAVSYPYLHKILRGLLREGAPIGDIETILETLLEAHGQNLPLEDGLERVRLALSGLLCERLRDSEGVLHAVLLDPTLEAHLEKQLRTAAAGAKLELSSAQVEYLWSSFHTKLVELSESGRPEVIVTQPKLRHPLRKLLASRLPQCSVLSRAEITAETALAGCGDVPPGKLFDAASRVKPARADLTT